MWVQETSLTWKYGKISITKTPYIEKADEITIICNPFKSTGPRCLQLNIQSQQDKSMNTVNKILQFFVQQRIVRNTRVNIKGGGLLLDVGGFACAIYMRGINNITYIPTTLLAMVDATVGGKTGINFGSAKNLVGSVKHPQNIIIDLKNLETLSDREFNNGLAQVIKMAITYDSEFFGYLEKIDLNSLRKPENIGKLKYIIQKSLQIKISVVQKDPYETYQRKWLNFGHTIGHGIELSSGHSLLHGQCVSIGMVKLLQISKELLNFNKKDVISRLKKLLQSINLPTQIPSQVDFQEMITLMLKDKKKSDSSNNIQFVMIKDIGIPEDNVTKIEADQLKQYFSKAIQIKSFEKLNQGINSQFLFPSSKSISLRFAYMSALSVLKHNKQVSVSNFLQSDDTNWMLLSLKGLGFEIQHLQAERRLIIHSYTPKDEGILNIGNSGVTARLILPLCASLKGKWTIDCHPRMTERPNQQIIKLCKEQFDCSIEFLKKQQSFPLVLKVNRNNFGLKMKSLAIDGNQSSQFITSIMIYGAFFHSQTQILTHKGTLVSQSYLQMTAKCLKYLGIQTHFETGKIKVLSHKYKQVKQFEIQTDLSSLSYPYVFSKIHNIQTPKLPKESMQGDILFYQYLQQLCKSNQSDIRFDFNNCTDTFMTFAVFVASPYIQKSQIRSITIYNIANQRVKESNRIHLTITNLQKVGIRTQEYENQIKIFTKFNIPQDQLFIFETANDHRLAMSFSILSTYLKNLYPSKIFIIDDKKAVDKTFPEFWSYLNKAGVSTEPKFYKKTLPQPLKGKNIVLIGDRGSGKTTMGRHLAEKFGICFIDLDDKITEQIKILGLNSITDYVQKYGWKAFRDIQSKKLQQYLVGKSQKTFLLATGAGIVQNKINFLTLQRNEAIKVYLQRDFEDLRILQTQHRPNIGNYRQISQKRAPLYQQLANIIVNIPERASIESQLLLIIKMIQKHLNSKPLKEGIILTINQIPKSLEQFQIDPNELSSIELRLDSLVQSKIDLKSIRRSVSLFQKNNEIDTLITLRTANELGTFTGDYNLIQNYISKMPTEFLDHQFVFPINYNYNPSKLFLSYHGQNSFIIRNLCNLQNFNGIKKLCLSGTHEKWEQYYRKLGDRSICINLNDSVSRLHNKYQFAVKAQIPNNKTGIMTFNQMKTLNTLRKILIRK